MKNQKFLKLLKRKKNDSGFTLLELLTGLVMSGIVIGVLGVGFYQVLKVTSEDASKSQARDQASRAIEFITDELRRSKTIDTSTPPSYTPPTNGTVRLALEIPGVSERVIYAVAPPEDDSPWKGPLVIYRWGPPFDADGNYTNENDVTKWKNLALVDQVDDTTQSITCEGNPISYQGFYACIEDDDGDEIEEKELTDTNGNGTVDDDDIDGIGTTAQLFFTGGISTATGNDTNYTTDTKVVTRVKEADVIGEKEEVNVQFGVEGLGSDFSCNPNATPNPTNWTMRTDFSQIENNPTEDRWIYDPDLRGKAFEIDPTKPLSITAIPIGASNCTNTKFDGKDNGSLEPSASWHDTDGQEGPIEAKDIVYTQHIIDFNNPYTFNGNGTIDENGNGIIESTETKKYNSPDVRDSNGDINPQVKVLKEGTIVPDVGGFDANGDGDNEDPGDQLSLGEFLVQKGFADLVDGQYVVNSNLKPDQRIIAFEIGQDIPSDTNSGFDLQDNIFVVTSKAFEKTFNPEDFQ